MINPSELVDNLVALLRDIPDLVVEMGGSQEAIFAYHDQYPKKVSLDQAVLELPAPGILVAWTGTAPGSFGGNDVWKHNLALFIRARETSDTDAPPYYSIFRLITKGVPVSAGQPMSNADVHPSCYPMDPPSIERESPPEGLDYFRVNLSFTEIGDE